MLSFFRRDNKTPYKWSTAENSGKIKELDTALTEYKTALQESKPNTLFHTNATKLSEKRERPSQLITLLPAEQNEKIKEIRQLTTLIKNMNQLVVGCLDAERKTETPISTAFTKYIPDDAKFNPNTKAQQDAIIFSMDHFIPDCSSFHENVSRFVCQTESEEKTNKEDIVLLSNFAEALVAVMKDTKDATALGQLLQCAEKINKKASLSTNLTFREIASKASEIAMVVFTVASITLGFFPPTMMLGMFLMYPAMFFMVLAHEIDVPDRSVQRAVAQSTKAISHHAKTFLNQLAAAQQPAVSSESSPPAWRRFLCCS